jgi:alpha-glucosidase
MAVAVTHQRDAPTPNGAIAELTCYYVAFPLYEKWGVAGVKIDFMDRDDQEMVNWYGEIARKAAEHHPVVDFHGAFKPTGLRRTYRTC